jgi:hypothetical protein
MKVSIIYNFNDTPPVKGTTTGGIKSEISFFDQFLISYYSITENWINDKFTFDFYIVHSIPFSQDKLKILNELGISLRQVETPLGPSSLRYHSLLEDIECDYKLLLDNDTIGLKIPNFDFSKDALIGYSGSKYTYQEWEKICKYINLELPLQLPLKTSGSINYNSWEVLEYLAYYNTPSNYNLFPSMNAGALLIKNSLSKSLGNLLKENSIKYHNYILERDKIDIGYVSQDIYGLCINQITKNWASFEPGFNFLVSILPSVRSLVNNYPLDQISLFHYINTQSDENYRFIPIIQKYNQKIYKNDIK